MPYGIELERVADQPTTVSESLWEFERSLLEALAIVLAVSLLSLGWRTGIVVGLSVPIVLGAVALVMLMMGWNLERVSLGSLIIALGLLVDDGIIAVEMMVVKMEQGWDRVKAAAFSYSATAMPRLTGALITVAAFMPIGFAKSVTAEYAGGIFWIVGSAVIFSWFVSGLITPYLAVKLLPKDLGQHHTGGDPYDTPFYRKLRRLIELALARRWWVIGATVAALALALPAMKLVPQQFFPSATHPELIVELRLKEGASFAATTEQVEKMEAVLAKDADVKYYDAYTGAGSPRFYLALTPELPNPGYAVFVVMTKDIDARERVRSRLMASVGEQFPDVWVRIWRLEMGPPVGFPVQFRVVGPDTQKVREIAREVEHVVASNPKVRDVQLDWNDPVRTLRVDLDQDKARVLGLAPADVALVTQTVMNGATLSQLREHEDLIDIVARAVPSERLDLDALKDVNVFTRHGTVVPLSQVARVRYELEEPVLWRRNRDMAITVRADVKDGEEGVSATQSIVPMLADIEAKLPSGYRIDVGGAVEESDKANRALAAVVPVMIVTILTILMLQLQSLSRMAMVFLTAPLGLIGVVIALLVTRAPLGFVAILGIIALSGMIMRNAVILIDQIQTEIAEGRDAWNAVDRGRGASNAAGRADRDRNRARDVPAHAEHLLGSDGGLDHGRPHGRDRTDDLLRAGAVRGVVPRAAHDGARNGSHRTGGASGGVTTMRATVKRHGFVIRFRTIAAPLRMLCAGRTMRDHADRRVALGTKEKRVREANMDTRNRQRHGGGIGFAGGRLGDGRERVVDAEDRPAGGNSSIWKSRSARPCTANSSANARSCFWMRCPIRSTIPTNCWARFRC